MSKNTFSASATGLPESVENTADATLIEAVHLQIEAEDAFNSHASMDDDNSDV